jgi:hypothetical protein
LSQIADDTVSGGLEKGSLFEDPSELETAEQVLAVCAGGLGCGIGVSVVKLGGGQYVSVVHRVLVHIKYATIATLELEARGVEEVPMKIGRLYNVCEEGVRLGRRRGSVNGAGSGDGDVYSYLLIHHTNMG